MSKSDRSGGERDRPRPGVPPSPERLADLRRGLREGSYTVPAERVAEAMIRAGVLSGHSGKPAADA